MIKDLTLNEAQKGSLAGRIEDLYLQEQIFISGVEVTHAQDEEDCRKVFFIYERENGTEGRNSIYCDFAIRDTEVTDFEEVHFDKEGVRL
jgi:hypothetical protein